jgi:uncharacterized protein YdhG (YjbR/CyaY superfamily)
LPGASTAASGPPRSGRLTGTKRRIGRERYRWPVDPAPDIDTFLAGLPDDLRAALQLLRTQIAAAAPGAIEAIAYGVPAFRYEGRPLVSFSAGRKGTGPCALYVQSPALLDSYRDALAAYDTGVGTIHFRPESPLPADLVARIVHDRMAETDRKGKP